MSVELAERRCTELRYPPGRRESSDPTTLRRYFPIPSIFMPLSPIMPLSSSLGLPSFRQLPPYMVLQSFMILPPSMLSPPATAATTGEARNDMEKSATTANFTVLDFIMG